MSRLRFLVLGVAADASLRSVFLGSDALEEELEKNKSVVFADRKSVV